MILKVFQQSLFLLLIFASLHGISHAHDSSVATLQIIRLSPDKWVFEVKTPLYGLDQAMRKFNANKSNNLTVLVVGSKKYKELIVEYVKAEFDISAWSKATDNKSKNNNHVKLTLGKGRIKLDDHVSTLVFEIKGMPKKSEKLEFLLPYMSHNEKQHNILRLIDGKRSKHYILSSSNNYLAIDTAFFQK